MSPFTVVWVLLAAPFAAWLIEALLDVLVDDVATVRRGT